MRIKIFLKKLISISVAAILAVTLLGCFDLGDFSDEEAYYDSFGDVGLVYNSKSGENEKDIVKKDYDIEDYFYKDSFKADEETGEEKYTPQLPYVYMAIPVESDLNVESVALYFKAAQTCSLEVFFYVVDDLPDFTNVRLLGDPEYQPETDDEGKPKYKQKVDEHGVPMVDTDGNPIYEQKVDEDGNPMFDEVGDPIYEPILQKVEYSDPDDSFIVGKTMANLKEGKWVSLLMDTWNGGRFVEINAGQYLLLRFVNNSGANVEGNSPAQFRVTNLLIRAVS